MINKPTGRSNDNYKSADTNSVRDGVQDKSRKSKGAFRTISEVADELGVQQHVLRFWETKFSHIRPLKRGGGRRYYRPEDVAVLKRIHELLYTEGYTIKGVQKLFRANGKSSVMEGEVGGAAHTDISIEIEVGENKDNGSSVAVETTTVNELAEEMAAPVQAGLNDEQRKILNVMLLELKELRSLVRPE